MKKPQKPLCALNPDEKIIGIGASKEHLNPKSRSFGVKPKTKVAFSTIGKEPLISNLTKL